MSANRKQNNQASKETSAKERRYNETNWKKSFTGGENVEGNSFQRVAKGY
jgi:hypothetical protein